MGDSKPHADTIAGAAPVAAEPWAGDAAAPAPLAPRDFGTFRGRRVYGACIDRSA
jgi:hypothetical protein